MESFLREKIEKSCASKHWKKIGIKPHHGFNLILSSIHSEKSCGIGEFYDLIPLIKWAKKIGLDFIQMLPLYDTGLDNSPYNPISIFALNPIFLSLHALPYLSDHPDLEEKLEKLQQQPLTQQVQYHKVREQKYTFLGKYFEAVFPLYQKQESYKKFVSNNPWVKDYALFNLFSKLHRTTKWTEWPKAAQKPTASYKKEVIKENKDLLISISFCSTFVQSN